MKRDTHNSSWKNYFSANSAGAACRITEAPECHLGSRRIRRAKRRPKPRSTALEPLEERTLLAVSIWDGGGADNNWMTAANWVGDAVPSAGDDLVFAGTARKNTVNNFDAGQSFSSIHLLPTVSHLRAVGLR